VEFAAAFFANESAVHPFIEAEKANFSIKVMCEVVDVSRSSVYERKAPAVATVGL
jgi:hypothetical protein